MALDPDLPAYVLDPSPLAMFTRLQRVGLHLEALQDEAMAEIGLTFSDYTILATLHREPPPHRLPVSRLAELVLRPMGSITQVVDRIETAGLVARHLDPDDRRRVLVELAPAGAVLAQQGDDAYRTGRERVLAQIDTHEQIAVDAAIFDLLEVLERDRRTVRRGS